MTALSLGDTVTKLLIVTHFETGSTEGDIHTLSDKTSEIA
jgi:hypothetical protein